jgi:hypothetical protein
VGTRIRLWWILSRPQTVVVVFLCPFFLSKQTAFAFSIAKPRAWWPCRVATAEREFAAGGRPP